MAAHLKSVTGGINQEREGGKEGGRDGTNPNLQTHPIDPSHLSMKLDELHPLRSRRGMKRWRFLLSVTGSWGLGNTRSRDVCTVDDER